MKTIISVAIDREDGSELILYSCESTSCDFAIELVKGWLEALKTEMMNDHADKAGL